MWAIEKNSQVMRFLNLNEKKAYIISKIYEFQFINTGIIVLLVNAKVSFLDLPEGFPVFNGKYTDFSFDWYAKVGMTLQLTMMTQIVVPPIVKVVSSLVPLF